MFAGRGFVSLVFEQVALVIIIIIKGLRDKLHSGEKSLIGNKGYRRYLKVARESVTIDLGALSEIDVPIRFCPIGRFK